MATRTEISSLENTSDELKYKSEEEETVALITSFSEDTEMETVPDNIARQLRKEFMKAGVKGMAEVLKTKLNSWKQQDLNVAVIGRTGVGKSSFINAIRGNLNEDDPRYAKVSYNECTSKRGRYPHPDNERLVFWDLPGVGTESFPRKAYLKHKELKISSYDVFVLMASDRFTEDEKWLAKEIEKMKKMFIFVRTKVDCQLESDKVEKERANKNHDPCKVVDEIRKNCMENLGSSCKNIFLISSLHVQNKYLDFGALLNRLVQGFSEVKAEAMLYTIAFLTPELLQEKVKYLKKRIWLMGCLSAIPGAIPIPGMSLVADALMIVNEIRLYRKILGLSDDDLKKIAEITGMGVEEMARIYSLKTLAKPLVLKGVIVSSLLILSEVDEVGVGLALPIPIGAAVSAATTVKLLKSALKLLVEDAKILLSILKSSTGNQLLMICQREKV